MTKFAIKLATGEYYKIERPTFWPTVSGNKQVVTFKSFDEADDYIIFNTNSKNHTNRCFVDAEITELVEEENSDRP